MSIDTPSLCEAVANSCRVSPGASVAGALPATPTCTEATLTAGGVAAVGAGFDPLHAEAMTRHNKTPDNRGDGMGAASIPLAQKAIYRTDTMWIAGGF